MLVYRSGARRLAIREALSDLENRIATLDCTGSRALDGARSILIDAGELEGGLTDVECVDEDDSSPLTTALDDLLGRLADVFVRVWCDGPVTPRSITETRRALRAVRSHSLPETIEVSVPEGFAFYGLFPETYIDATNELVRVLAPRSVVVIGIRSIGTSLSAVVAGTLRSRGIATHRLTVRPRGHPFDRRLRLSPGLTSRLRDMAARSETIFAIVDEGPGLSGSSFASVAETIAALGAADDRIALLPSWNAQPAALSSARARRVWPRHVRFVGDFDRLWLGSGKLEAAFGATLIQDLSAGSWRRLFFAGDEPPAIQPQHERRKFLLETADGERMLIKFEGLDRGCGERRKRAERAAGAGFAPPVTGFTHGFLAMSWVEGMPLEARGITPDVLRRVADYMAWTSRCERTGSSVDPLPLIEMLRVNVEESLGVECSSAAVSRANELAGAVARSPAVRVDGRMLPHEWLRTPDGILKTDVASHFDDHFYPGATDVAWDLAAAIIEFQLDSAATRLLVHEYRAASGDEDIGTRLRFMRPVYAAFRLGYTALAATALGAGEDASRLRDASNRYAEVLRCELSAAGVGGQSCATGT